MTYTPSLQQFSDAYYIFSDARIIEYDEDYPVVANDTYDYINRHIARPLFKIGTSYMWPKSEASVPPDVIAVPRGSVEDADKAEVLVPSYKTCEQLVRNGTVERPSRVGHGN